jgi:hypothetical protein
MHKAPAVRYPLGPSRFLAWLLAIFWFGGAAVFSLGALVQPSGDGIRVLGWIFPPLSAVLAWHWWRARVAGELHWDGQQWLYSTGSLTQPGTLRVQIDLQTYLWIEWRTLGTGKVEWLWVERDRLPVVWQDFRRAVFA